MEVKLVVARGKHRGREVPVSREKFFIGRAGDCHLKPQSDSVSQHHCVILVEGGFVAVRDLGSKTGSYVNGERVTGEQELKPGDRLTVGDLEFEVQVGVGAGGRKAKVQNGEVAAAGTVESSEDDEFDLDRWLSDSPMTDTTPPEATGAATTEITEPQPAAEEPNQEKPATVVGVWQKGKWKPSSADPRKAAADALKDFFKRP